MTTVGSLPADLAPGNEAAGKSAMDLPPSPTNSVPFIVATSADDDKPMSGPIDDESPMHFLQVCSKLDMEPNPFEQSFAGGASSEKADSVGPSAGTGLETPKPVLPPIAAMSGRLAPGTDLGWDAQSLRMGPLSPSMLAGPQQPITIEGNAQNSLPIGSFPSAASSINTVFTSGAPVAENGLPYGGLPGTLPVPPPVAMQQADPYAPAVYNQPHPMAQSQSQSQSSHQQQPPSHSHHSTGLPGGPGPRPPQHFTHPTTHQQQPHDRYMPPQAPQHNMNNGNNHMNQYGNLHLLSQQAQASRGPWIKRESTDSNGGSSAPYNQLPHPHASHPHHPQQSHPHPSQSHHHPNAHPGPHQNSGQGIPGVGGSHPSRNSVDSGFNPSTRRSRAASEDFSDDSEESSKNSINGGDHSGSNNSNSKKKAKPGTGEEKMDDEEKRKNFLERNRQAALKCRQRKKQWLTNLQAKVEYLTNDNEHLQGQTAALRDEIIHLKALLLAHKDCPVAQANGVYADSVGLPSHSGMMNHSHPPHPMQQQQQQQQPGPLRGGPGQAPGQPRSSLSHPPPLSHPQQHPHGPGPMQGGGGGPRMMIQPGPGPVPQHPGQVGPMGNVVGGGRPMSMMQDITPNASPNQGQGNARY
ncbi:MAG: hypothetical protein J3R72DRAFT_429553 [Linnemannia gamsii]|nr:MAG: hypothetical protein J3R72DRAFT_429553 [Linnemannia gamsii]